MPKLIIKELQNLQEVEVKPLKENLVDDTLYHLTESAESNKHEHKLTEDTEVSIEDVFWKISYGSLQVQSHFNKHSDNNLKTAIKLILKKYPKYKRDLDDDIISADPNPYSDLVDVLDQFRLPWSLPEEKFYKETIGNSYTTTIDIGAGQKQTTILIVNKDQIDHYIFVGLKVDKYGETLEEYQLPDSIQNGIYELPEETSILFL